MGQPNTLETGNNLTLRIFLASLLKTKRTAVKCLSNAKCYDQ